MPTLFQIQPHLNVWVVVVSTPCCACNHIQKWCHRVPGGHLYITTIRLNYQSLTNKQTNTKFHFHRLANSHHERMTHMSFFSLRAHCAIDGTSFACDSGGSGGGQFGALSPGFFVGGFLMLVVWVRGAGTGKAFVSLGAVLGTGGAWSLGGPGGPGGLGLENWTVNCSFGWIGLFTLKDLFAVEWEKWRIVTNIINTVQFHKYLHTFDLLIESQDKNMIDYPKLPSLCFRCSSTFRHPQNWRKEV